MADNAPRVGALIKGEAYRDAIHVAVAPAEAGEGLNPGERVGIGDNGKAYRHGRWEDDVGIVDPFLNDPVRRGERFWLFVFPNTVTSLRHAWTHPAFARAAAPARAAGGRQAFEEALRADPYDRVTRLAYADWLEENDLPEESARQRSWTARRQRAEDHLREFADACQVSLEVLLERAGDYLDQDPEGQWAGYRREATLLCDGFDTPEIAHGLRMAEFWEAYRELTGRDVGGDPGTFVTCSC